MKLPFLNSGSVKSSVTGLFNGIGTYNLSDAVNLIYNDKCHIRNPRKAIMFNSQKPDQIIMCENMLFFRYGNRLKEVVKNPDNTFTVLDTEYSLKITDPKVDRSVIKWENKLYVFPDNIQLGEDVWYPFAKDYAVSVSLPFINPRTLFYTSGYYGDEACGEAFILKPGMKLRFSWLPSKEFMIKTVEEKSYIDADEILVDEGIRITLDADVSGYNRIPQNATIEYLNPQNRTILNDFVIGYNHQIAFSGSYFSVFAKLGEANYKLNLNDFFKVGQMVKISGASIAKNNATAKITNISGNSLRLDFEFTDITEAEKTIITITPIIPDFSHFLLTEDRLFGVDNSTGKFHISALKNPFLFYDNITSPEDAWSVKIDEYATGLAVWKDSVICFTENGGFRILGYTALNFGIRQLSLNGIKKGYGNSLVRVGDTLYYYSNKGVMKYSGGSDKKISSSTTQIKNVKAAITDGVFVYMLAENRIWIYDTDSEIWWSENAENIQQIFNFDSQRYICTEDVIYVADSDAKLSVDWSFELSLLPDEEHNRVQPLYYVLNYTGDTDCIFSLYLKNYGDLEWKRCGTFSIKNEGVLKIPLLKQYCNGFSIKVEGRGKFSPESWTAYYRRCK